MDLLNLYAKVSLDASEYRRGVKESIDYSDNLKTELKKVNSEVKSLTQQYKQSVNSTGRYSDQTKELADKLEQAKKKQADLTDELKESQKITSKYGDGLSGVVSKLGSFAKAGGIVVGALTAVGAGLNAVEEATEEYRVAQGKLNTAFEAAGYNADVAREAYQGLYAIIGDTDTATEAAQLMAKLSDSVEDFSTWTDIAAGVAGTFGDALPINSLIEAANETAKVGEVTGVLADALNWAGISEDDFNSALAECSNESERNRLIMDTLSQTYDDATDAFYRNNEEVVAARTNQALLDEAMANLGSTISGVKNNLLDEYTPAIVAATNATSDFISKLAQSVSGELSPFKAFYQSYFVEGKGISESMAAAGKAAGQAYNQKINPNGIPGPVSPYAGPLASLPSAVESGVQGLYTRSQASQKTVADYIAEAGAAADQATKKTTSATQKSTEKQKTLLEQLQEEYKATSDALSTEIDNMATEYDIWAEKAGESVSEADLLAKQLETLTSQHEKQKDIVAAAKKAYDDYTASQDATEAGTAELKNTLLKEQLALAELQTEIDGTTKELDRATDATLQYQDALEAAKEETGNFAGSLSSLGGDIEDLGELLGVDLVSDFGAFISKVGGGISTVLNLVSSVSSLTQSLSSLSTVAGSLGSLGSAAGSGGILSSIGSLLGGSGGLGGLGLAAVVGGGLYLGNKIREDIWEVWTDENKSIFDKVLGTIWSFGKNSPASIIFDAINGIFGKKEEELETDESGSTSTGGIESGGITSGTISGGTVSGGDTIIEKVEIFIEGAKYDDPASLAEAISIELQNLTERRINVFA